MRVLILFLLMVFTCCEEVFRRFEYKHGFKPPYISQNDGSVLFWDISGSAMASKDNVRVTPSLKSQKGMIWNRYPLMFQWWEVEMWIRVTSRGRIGADGLAFWYTSERMQDGVVFGSKDKWTGLAVIFDSYDNDNKRNNPYVSAIINDGTQSYNHDHDGQGQAVAGCMRDFRNKPHPVRARITYLNHVLTLEIHNGITSSERDFDVCFRAENVVLPQRGFLGVTAATGGLADDHDVLRLVTHSLYASQQQAAAAQQQQQQHETMSEPERQRLQHEFDEYQRKTEQAKAEYRAQHPDAKDGEARDQDAEDGLYEEGMTREMRQLLESQGHLFDAVKRLDAKMDTLVGRQESVMSMLSEKANVAHAPASSEAVQQLTSMTEQQRHLSAAVQQLRMLVQEVNDRSLQLIQQQQQGTSRSDGAQPVASLAAASDSAATLNEIRAGVRSLQRDVTAVAAAQLVLQPDKATFASVESCVTSRFTVAALVGQALLLSAVCLVFVEYRAKKQAKKLF